MPGYSIILHHPENLQVLPNDGRIEQRDHHLHQDGDALVITNIIIIIINTRRMEMVMG